MLILLPKQPLLSSSVAYIEKILVANLGILGKIVILTIKKKICNRYFKIENAGKFIQFIESKHQTEALARLWKWRSHIYHEYLRQ